MNKEQDYASDSDESDEDFRPDAPGDSPASEEESNGSENEEEHEGGDESTKQNVRKSKKLTKKVSKKKKCNDKDDDSDEDTAEENDSHDSQARRCTRQTDEALTNGKGKSNEKDHLDSDEEDKSRTNALWADFLMDVKPAATQTPKPNRTTNQETASSSSNGKVQPKVELDKAQTSRESNKPSKEEPKKVTVTDILDFAGEEVRVEREIDASSIKENKAAVTTAPKKQPFGRIMPGSAIKRPAGSGSSSASGGLGSLLNQIGKKKKISVLEKSQMDWKSFKTDEGIDEQLQTFNKGKDGYLERQDFLQRTDVRQFEIEKNLRQSSRRPH